jgi:hypothetical protein
VSSEAALWNWLRARLPRSGHYSRIESETSPGFPDVNYCIGEVEGNIELKCSRYPKARYPFKKGGLRKSQKVWIRQRIRAGGKVFILAQVGKERFLINGQRNLNSMTLEDLEFAQLLYLNHGGVEDSIKHWLTV